VKAAPRPRALPGREPERERFAECLDQARQGLPTLLLFEGEAGSGKTSLLDEIEPSPLLPRRRIRVVRLDLAMLEDRDPVRHAAERITHTRLFRRFGGRRRFGAMASKLLPEWMGAVPVFGDLLEALTVTAQVIRKRFRGKQERTGLAEDIEALHRHAQRRPTALLIDDLHLVEEAAADRMLKLLRDARTGTRLLVIGTVATPTPGARRTAVRALLDRLPADRIVHHRLGTLTREDLRDWMAVRFPHRQLPDAAIDFLLAESGGQPGAVQGLLERLLESGTLRDSDDGWAFDSAASGEQLGDIEPTASYLGELSDDVASIIGAASVFGDQFDALSLARLLDADELELEDQLAVALRAGLIIGAGVRSFADGDISSRYRFASSSLRAALHRNLPPARRQELESRAEPEATPPRM
jgi:predicted ATPase